MNLKKLGIKNINSGACIVGKDWIDSSDNSFSYTIVNAHYSTIIHSIPSLVLKIALYLA